MSSLLLVFPHHSHALVFTFSQSSFFFVQVIQGLRTLKKVFFFCSREFLLFRFFHPFIPSISFLHSAVRLLFFSSVLPQFLRRWDIVMMILFQWRSLNGGWRISEAIEWEKDRLQAKRKKKNKRGKKIKEWGKERKNMKQQQKKWRNEIFFPLFFIFFSSKIYYNT